MSDSKPVKPQASLRTAAKKSPLSETHNADNTQENDDRQIDRLLAIMEKLRNPDTGCPWDVQQDFASIAPYTIEEAYEVADAIARNDLIDLRDELGDLLLQVVFHARMAEEASQFDFEDVARSICEKMIRRHPHVFGDSTAASTTDLRQTWEAIKAAEKAARKEERTKAGSVTDLSSETGSLLDDIPLALPALTRAEKLQKRAAGVGFDWPEVSQVREKLTEEIGELDEAIQSGDADSIEDELGDVLFVIANLARHAGIDPESALRRTNNKFTRRFASIEKHATNHCKALTELSLNEMEAAWQDAKRDEDH